MAAAAIPAISLGAQFFMNRKAGKQKEQALQGLQQGSQALTGAGQDLLGQSRGLFDTGGQELAAGRNLFDQAGSYYLPILRGERGAMDAAQAPERAQITDIYRGASKALEQKNVIGGARATAEAELARDRAGQLGMLGLRARPEAAAAVAGLGAQRFGNAANIFGTGAQVSGQGVSALGAAGRPYEAQLYQSNLDQKANRETSGAIGSMIFDVLKGSGGGGGSKGRLPSRPGPVPLGTNIPYPNTIMPVRP